MIIDMDKLTIEAKSFHENYVKEAGGSKPNTHRIVNDMEAGQLKALQTALVDEHKAVTLVLTDIETKESVRRQVMDIDFAGSRYGHDEVTISWRHVSLEGEE